MEMIKHKNVQITSNKANCKSNLQKAETNNFQKKLFNPTITISSKNTSFNYVTSYLKNK